MTSSTDRSFADTSPIVLAALHKLGELAPADIEAICLHWLESGAEGDCIASLALGPVTSIDDADGEFQCALREAGATLELTTRQTLWLVFRHYLEKLKCGEADYLDTLRKLAHLEMDWDNRLSLFPRPDCDAHFEERRKRDPNAGYRFAGQGFGIEPLLGLLYASDGDLHWDSPKEAERRQAVMESCQTILERFYSADSDLVDDLAVLNALLQRPVTT